MARVEFLKAKYQESNQRKPLGRPLMYQEPTTRLDLRVPISHKESIKRIVKEYLNKLKK